MRRVAQLLPIWWLLGMSISGCAWYNPAVNPIGLLSDGELTVNVTNRTGESVDVFFNGDFRGQIAIQRSVQFTVAVQEVHGPGAKYRGKGTVRVHGSETGSSATCAIDLGANLFYGYGSSRMAYCGQSIYVKHKYDSPEVFVEVRSQ